MSSHLGTSLQEKRYSRWFQNAELAATLRNSEFFLITKFVCLLGSENHSPKHSEALAWHGNFG